MGPQEYSSTHSTINLSYCLLLIVAFVAVVVPVSAYPNYRVNSARCDEHPSAAVHSASNGAVVHNSVALDRTTSFVVEAGAGSEGPVDALCRGRSYTIQVKFSSPRAALVTASQGSFEGAVTGCPNRYALTAAASSLTLQYTAPCTAAYDAGSSLVLFRVTSASPGAPLDLLGTSMSVRLDVDLYSTCTADSCTATRAAVYSGSDRAGGLPPITPRAAVDDWLDGQALAFFPTRLTYTRAAAACEDLHARLVTVQQWLQAVDDMNANSGLGNILVELLVGLFNFGDNGGRPWNAWGVGAGGKCGAVQIDAATVQVVKTGLAVDCGQTLYYMCIGPYFILDPPPPPPPSPPPPPPRPPVVPNNGVTDRWDARVWTFFSYRASLTAADARCREIGNGAHLASLPEWTDVSDALVYGQVPRLYNAFSSAMFYFGDYGGRPWNLWAAGGPGPGLGGCGAVRVDPLAILVTNTSLSASCSQTLMFMCVQLAAGAPAVPPPSPPPPRPAPPPAPPAPSTGKSPPPKPRPPPRVPPRPPVRPPRMPPSPQPPSPRPPKPMRSPPPGMPCWPDSPPPPRPASPHRPCGCQHPPPPPPPRPPKPSPAPPPTTSPAPRPPPPPNPRPPPPGVCPPSSQGYACSLPLGEGMTLHYSPASVINFKGGALPVMSPAPPASKCVMSYTNASVRGVFHMMLEAPAADQLSLAFLPSIRGGMSPGISTFIADNGGLLANTYQATLIPAPGDSVQPYDPSSSCEYGPGPWPVGPPQTCNWAAGFAAVRLSPAAGSTAKRLALCFTAASMPLGARSPDAFLATLVPEQSGGTAMRRQLLQLHEPDQHIVHSGTASRSNDSSSSSSGSGSSLARRMAWNNYFLPSPPPPSPPPPSSPPPGPGVVEGSAVAARLGAAAGDRRLLLLRRAAVSQACESGCAAQGLILGASSQPGHNLTGAAYEAAWGALLQQAASTSSSSSSPDSGGGGVVGGWVGPASPTFLGRRPPSAPAAGPPACTSTALRPTNGTLRTTPCTALGWCICFSTP